MGSLSNEQKSSGTLQVPTRNLGPHKFAIFRNELQRRQRSALIAYALWFFFGHFGIHHFYLKQYGRALSYLGAYAIPIASLLFAFAKGLMENKEPTTLQIVAMVGLIFVPIAFAVFMWIWDLCTLGSQTERYNLKIEMEILKSLESEPVATEPPV